MLEPQPTLDAKEGKTILVLKCLIILLIIPELLGVTVCGVCGIWNRRFFRYIIGFLTMVAMAYVVYLPLEVTGRSFHRYVQLLSIAFVVVSAVGLIFFGKKTFREYVETFKSSVDWVKKHPGILLFVGILAFQIYRIIAYTQINYSDDDTYISLVGDILNSDWFFRRNWVDGRNLSAWYTLDKKYLWTGWFSFHAYLCRVLGLAPLVLVKTVLPVVLTILHYLVVVDFLGVISKRRGEVLSYFLPIYALLLEFGWSSITTSLSYYFLTWIWYGKSFVEFIVLPCALAQLLVTRWNKLQDWCVLALIALAGIGASTMGFILIPAMGGMFLFTLLVQKVWERRRAACSRP